jgi:hypothetical protein
MKIPLRFAGLFAIICLSWLSTNVRANAATDPLPYCSTYDLQPCYTPGATVPCWADSGETHCFCKPNLLKWICLYPA